MWEDDLTDQLSERLMWAAGGKWGEHGLTDQDFDDLVWACGHVASLQRGQAYVVQDTEDGLELLRIVSDPDVMREALGAYEGELAADVLVDLFDEGRASLVGIPVRTHRPTVARLLWTARSQAEREVDGWVVGSRLDDPRERRGLVRRYGGTWNRPADASRAGVTLGRRPPPNLPPGGGPAPPLCFLTI